MKQRIAERAGSRDDATQSGMRMDVCAVGFDDEQVVLARAGVHVQDVAGHFLSGASREACGPCESEILPDIGVSQPVSLRCSNSVTTARPIEAVSYEADAIEPCLRVATMQAEGRSDELPCAHGDARAEIAHCGLGYCASRSLPGRNGSPWKFAALPKRLAHVASK